MEAAMIDGHRVVAYIPFGRRLTVTILMKYLLAEHAKGVLDELQLWRNLEDSQHDDWHYAEELRAEHDWITVIDRPLMARWPKQLNTVTFYQFCNDADAIYVRLDDDIVFLARDALAKLAEAGLRRRFALCCFPVIINNATVSYFLQEQRDIRWSHPVGNYCMDPIGWGNGAYAEWLHTKFLDAVDAGRESDFHLYQDIPLPYGHQFSVSCFATRGEEYISPGLLLQSVDDEQWHTLQRPQEVQRPNVIIPDALVSHFSFYPQRRYLLEQTDILERYARLADSYP